MSLIQICGDPCFGIWPMYVSILVLSLPLASHLYIRCPYNMTGQAVQMGHLIAIVRTTKSILRARAFGHFCNANQSLSLYVVAFRVRIKYISFVHVFVLIILFKFDILRFGLVHDNPSSRRCADTFNPVTRPVCPVAARPCR